MPAPLVGTEATDAQPQTADVVVIGGCIVGVFAAYYSYSEASKWFSSKRG
jgi:hypothetical protein